MDQRVLEAQQWVNATYTGVPGYNRVDEDGSTGWQTMYALTRALQYELGITALSDAFGPTTLSKLEARGGVKTYDENTNLIKIVQCACYCKGYEAGGIDGVFSMYTMGAVNLLMHNAGLSESVEGAVPPKVMKALLTMDAYVVLAGGTESVRSVQRWLNSRYVSRKNFFIIPCDGIFSRDVQKALYLAIQFELGMTDDQATGVFGPGTQAGLKAHLLSQGSTGIFVRLFSAAMVFNRVRLRSGSIYADFTDTYGSGLVSAVQDFQKFSALAETGNADFATWCQLLVSTGDPNRAGTVCDCITTITDARAQGLRSNGYEFVGRYLDEKPNAVPKLNKQIQPGELDTIFRNGLKVFPISQYYGGEVSYFTYSQGFADAVSAFNAAVNYGFNTGTVIYFAVDYDATQAEIDSNIVPYFRGVVAGLADNSKKYIHGVYGSRNVCTEVTKRTNARWSFVSGMSTGFSGNMGFPLPENWAFNQIQTLKIGSGDSLIEIDKGVYRPRSDPGTSSVNDRSTPIDDFVAYVRHVYNLAVGYGNSATRSPNRLVLEFLRHQDYNDIFWEALIGDIDTGFIDYVLDTGIEMIVEVAEPFYGVDIKVSHLAASCNGVYVHGRPAGTGINRADVADWGGDWCTFYGEWRRDSSSYSSGYTYCKERLAKMDGNGTFKLRDLIEDADAYNIGMKARAGVTIADAFDAYYRVGGHLTRFTQFYNDRFAGDSKAIAKNMLTSADDELIAAGRTQLIESTGGIPTLLPSMLPDDKLDEFCQGFTEMILTQVDLETT